MTSKASRLLLITSTYPTDARPRQGAFNHELVVQLRRRHDVRVIAPVPWPQRLFMRRRDAQSQSAQDDRRRNPRRSCQPDSHLSCPTLWYPPRLWRESHGRWYLRSIGAAVDALSADFSPDAVLSYWSHPDGEAALRIAGRWSVPLVAIVGGSDVRLLARNPGRRQRIAEVLKSADRVVAVSRELAHRVADLGVAANRIDVIYRGVDRQTFYPADREEARSRLELDPKLPIILWVGRFVGVKAPETLVRAAAVWKRSLGVHFRVVMIGDGPLQRRVRRLARALRVDDVLRLLPALPQSHLAEWYRAANVTVLTSRSEGIPNVLLESIACGTPFVASHVGGIAEIASMSHDRLVPPGDPSALAAAVAENLGDTRDGLLREASGRTFVPGDSSQFADGVSSSLARAQAARRKGAA